MSVLLNKNTIIKKSKEDSFNLLQELKKISKTKGLKKSSVINNSKCSRVLVLSDWHVGKLITNLDTDEIVYDNNILEERVNILTKEFINLCSKTSKLEEIVIVLVGDILDGYGIYIEQAHHQYESSPVKQALSATKLIWNVIKTIKTKFSSLPIRVICVRGNHGRLSEDSSPEANWDLVVYEQLKLINNISEKQLINIEISDSRIINNNIAGCKIHCRHEAPAQSETSGAMAKFGGWAIKHNFDILTYGHFHSPMYSVFNNRYIIRNGCLCGSDDLAEKISKGSKASQTSFVICNKKITEYNVIEVE